MLMRSVVIATIASDCLNFVVSVERSAVRRDNTVEASTSEWIGPVRLRELAAWGALSASARPPFAETRPARWVRACDGKDQCGEFSKGAGGCPLAVLLSKEISNGAANDTDGANGSRVLTDGLFRVVPVHSACRTRQSGWAMHCPTEAPLAALVIEKAGYMSSLSWLAQLDAAPIRVTLGDGGRTVTLAERWREAAEAALLGPQSYAKEWLLPELEMSGYSAKAAQDLAEKAAAYHSHKDSIDVTRTLQPDPDGYVRAWMPPHLCHSCCQPSSVGRLALVFVRNPYSRLESYFRMRLLDTEPVVGTAVEDDSNAHLRTTWDDFPKFIQLVGRLRNETDAYQMLPAVWDHPLKALGASKDLLFHTRAVTEWLTAVGLIEPDVHAVRLERAGSDLAKVEHSLCQRFGYCKPLPPFPHLHGVGQAPGGGHREEPPHLWTQQLTAEMLVQYGDDFKAFGYGPHVWQRKPVPPLCVVISAHYKHPTRAIHNSLKDLGRLYQGEVVALLVDDASPVAINLLVPKHVSGVELHLLKADRSRYGPELGAWGRALDSGLCDGAKYYAFLLSAVRFHKRFDFEAALPCRVSPIWTFPLRRPENEADFDCCGGSGCQHKERNSGWARPELREWAMSRLPAVLRRQWSGEEPRGGVQGPSFLATADVVQSLRQTGVFRVRTDEEWQQQASERLLAFVFKSLGHEPAECSVEGNLFKDWYSMDGDECHPHPYRNPIVQAGRTRFGRYFAKTFGVVPGRKWRKIYLVQPGGGLRSQSHADWRKSSSHASLLSRLAAPKRESRTSLKLPFAAAALFAGALPLLTAFLSASSHKPMSPSRRLASVASSGSPLSSSSMAPLSFSTPSASSSSRVAPGSLHRADEIIPALRYGLRNARLALWAHSLFAEADELDFPITRLAEFNSSSGVASEQFASLVAIAEDTVPLLKKVAERLRTLGPSPATWIAGNGHHIPKSSVGWSVELESVLSKLSSRKQTRITSMPSVGIRIPSDYGLKGCRDVAARAIELGYRRLELLDLSSSCALGVHHATLRSGLPRRELFFTMGGGSYARPRKQLAALHLAYVDLYLLCGPLRQGWQETWRDLENLHARGVIQALGVEGLTDQELNDVVGAAAVGSMSIVHTDGLSGFGAEIAASSFVLKLRSTGISHEEPHVVALARRHGVPPAAVVLRWALHRGHAVSIRLAYPGDVRDVAVELAPSRLLSFSLSTLEVDTVEGLASLFKSRITGGCWHVGPHLMAVRMSDQDTEQCSDNAALARLFAPALGVNESNDPLFVPPAPVQAVLQEDWVSLDAIGAAVLELASSNSEFGHAMHSFAHSRDTFIEHLRGVWAMLTVWGQPLRVRLFGSLHSFFGTGAFRFTLIPRSSESFNALMGLIGREAASLVDKFSKLNETDLTEAVFRAGKIPDEGLLVDNILEPLAPVKLTAHEAAEVLVMSMADLFDQSFTVNAWRDVTLLSRPRKLWPGIALPAMNVASLAKRCAIARPHLEVAPPIFDGCTASLEEADAARARELYWMVVTSDEKEVGIDQRVRFMEMAVQHNPFLAEPFVLLAQLRFSAGQDAAAQEAAERALRLFYVWGTCWDKRVPFRQWVAFTQLLLKRLRRRLRKQELADDDLVPHADDDGDSDSDAGLPWVGPRGEVAEGAQNNQTWRVDLSVLYTPPARAELHNPPNGKHSARDPSLKYASKKTPQSGRINLSVGLPAPHMPDYQGLRIYVYDLPSMFHEDLVAEMERRAKEAGTNCDFMRSACTERRHVGDFSTARQWGAEVIMLRKFLANPARVNDPALADVFVVPFLLATTCRLSGHYIRCLNSPELPQLFQHLEYYNLATRHRHLFLASADIHSLPLAVQTHPLVASYGANTRNLIGHLVVPPSVAEEEFQPAAFQVVSDQDKDILIWLAQTPNNAVRYMVQRQLIVFDQAMPQHQREQKLGVRGRILVHVMGRNEGLIGRVPSPAEMLAEMKRAQFCPATPAENTAAGTKRFFDVLLAGCLPVVIKYATVWGSGVSWWRRDGPPLEWGLPFPWEVDWQRLVVEVPISRLEKDGDFVMAILEVTPQQRKEKLDYLLQVRERLLYDFEGGRRDAFSVFLDGLRAALPRLDASATLPGRTLVPRLGESLSTVCDCSPRGLDFHALPRDFGPGTGNEKAWGHSNGELSCRGAADWRPLTADMAENAFLGSPEFPIVAERFYTSKFLRSSKGSAGAFLQVLAESDVSAGSESAVLSKAPLAMCTHRVWPFACHDKMHEDEDTDELVITFCHRSELINAPPNTTCRLLPPTLPQLEASPTLTVTASPVYWEIVTWACNLTSEGLEGFLAEWENTWWDRMPANHKMSLVVYEVCIPAATTSTVSGRARITESMILLEHVVAMMHAQRQGHKIADALLLVPDHWVEQWVTPWFTRPSHLLNTFAEILRNKFPTYLDENSHAKKERFFIAIDGPQSVEVMKRGGHDSGTALDRLCEKFTHIMSSYCPVPQQIAESAPQALAFPMEVLRDAPISDWEVVVSHRLGEDRHWREHFDLLAALVVREMGEAEVAFTSYLF